MLFNKIVLFASVPFLIYGLWFLTLRDWPKFSSSLHLANSYSQTEATVIKSEPTEKTRYLVSYHFSVNGLEYEGQDEIHQKHYQPATKNVAIKYDPSAPSYNQLSKSYYTPFLVLTIIFTVISFVVFMLSMLTYIITKNQFSLKVALPFGFAFAAGAILYVFSGFILNFA